MRNSKIVVPRPENLRVGQVHLKIRVEISKINKMCAKMAHMAHKTQSGAQSGAQKRFHPKMNPENQAVIRTHLRIDFEK